MRSGVGKMAVGEGLERYEGGVADVMIRGKEPELAAIAMDRSAPGRGARCLP